MKAINIKWDIDDDLTKEEQEDILAELPMEVKIPDVVAQERIEDYPSYKYGWCVDSFVIEERIND